MKSTNQIKDLGDMGRQSSGSITVALMFQEDLREAKKALQSFQDSGCMYPEMELFLRRKIQVLESEVNRYSEYGEAMARCMISRES